VVKTCNVGDVFGELALLYNCPRAASVESRDKCVVWELDRQSFNHIVKGAVEKKRQVYNQFLKSVTLLQSMEEAERQKIADVLKTEAYDAGAEILKMGDAGDKLYFLEEGSAKAVIGDKEVLQYEPSSFFGELALLDGSPRAATVIAVTNVSCVTLDRDSFKRLLGPLEDILRREADNYVKVEEEGKGLQSGQTADTATVEAKDEEEEDEDEDEDDDDDVVDEMPPPPATYMKKGPRGSVSAEAYGDWNKKDDNFTAPVHAKPDETKERLRTVLAKSFMFSSLGGKEMAVVVDAMLEVTLEPKTRIINQGDDGDCLYIIEEGCLDCIIKKPDGEEIVVKTCNVGDVFGELALLYNAPRAASVESRDKCVVWKLDRATFSHIVKDAAVKRRAEYVQFLRSVELLQSMEEHERQKVAEVVKSESFPAGTNIISEGDAGDRAFFLEEGTASAMKAGEKVMGYNKGDYFGELALLNDAPRAATVQAESDVVCVSVDRLSFKRLLGPLEKLLKGRAAQYSQATSA